VFVESEFWQLRCVHALQTFADGTDKVGTSVAVEYGEAPSLRRVVDAHPLRVVGVTFEYIFEEGEEMIEGAEEFGAVFVGDSAQVAGNPAGEFKVPFADQAEEAVIGGDIGEEGESAATEGAVVALATVGAEAGERNHAAWEVQVHFAATRFKVGGRRTFAAAVTVPKVGHRLEICPLAFIRGRDCVADVATKRFAAWVVQRALFAAVEFGNGGIEAVVDGSDVCRGEVGGRAEDADHAEIIAEEAVSFLIMACLYF
jgi:hypothetical protein